MSQSLAGEDAALEQGTQETQVLVPVCTGPRDLGKVTASLGVGFPFCKITFCNLTFCKSRPQ